MFGVLNLDKPMGWTSRDAVNRVHRLVRPAKAGHAGTLDPLASGVLVVCVGPATRLISYVQEMPKQYTASFLLGRQSPSDDLETEVEILPDAVEPTRGQLEAALPKFLGRIQQTPPAYSAVKVQGKRAYKSARQGVDVQIEPRWVRVDTLSIIRYEYPTLELEIGCGGGTYVRSLGRDLAEAVGAQAVMSSLRRTAVGCFTLDNAVDPRSLDADSVGRHLLSPLTAAAHLPRVELDQTALEDILHGRAIGSAAVQERVANASPGSLPAAPSGSASGEIVAIDAGDRMIAILRRRPDGMLAPARVFSQSV